MSARLQRVTLLITAAVLLAGGCATQPEDLLAPDYDPELLSGRVLFGEVVEISEATSFDVLATDDAMVEFVQGHISEQRQSVVRLKRLLSRLEHAGYFNAYQIDATRTALDTFHTQSGNCLSYTNMFIALARLAGLNAGYQIVEMPPTWDAESGYLIRNNHINVIVHSIRWERFENSEFTVDFGSVQPAAHFNKKLVSDGYAQSLFYSNLSVDQSVTGNHRLAFAYLKRAILIEPRNSDLWVNLGALYNVREQPELAIKAFEVVLDLDPGNKAAWSGLERSYTLSGQHELALVYERKVRNYRENNPCYHYAMAQAAYKTADYDLAITSVDRAIKLNNKDGRFHFLKALSHGQLGDEEN
ncbi:MAG: tetratricopeptide repeat protein [Proteobacteria bacterium]|nr:tetratricopeptide repeat protein [Pseudomonadota bacterium]